MPSSGVILEHLDSEFNFLKAGALYNIKQVICWMVRALLMYYLINVIKVCVNIAGEHYLLYLTDCCGRCGDLDESKRATIVVGFSRVTWLIFEM